MCQSLWHNTLSSIPAVAEAWRAERTTRTQTIAPMKSDLLCIWLGLPKSAWPPDPWTLLGLPREERDLGVIEQRVQDRMSTLRTYQLSYPEEATEGMNRLAEAFITLAETSSKAAPPAPGARSQADAGPERRAPSKHDTTVLEHTKVDWRDAPPPVRAEAPDGPDEPVQEEDTDATEVLVAQPFVAPAKPHLREIDAALMHALGQESEEATSNVRTLDAVIERVEVTRRLLHAWEKVGKLLRSRATKTSAKENDLFAKRLGEIAELMEQYPAFLGQPGKPGYRVVVLAKFKVLLSMVRGMGEEQHGDLHFDWQAGRAVLLEHRKYLRQHFQSLRRRTSVGLVLHAVRAFVNDYPWPTLIAVTLLVVLVVLGSMAIWWR